MNRLLACAVIFGGCLAAVGCDTSAGTGNVPPQVSVTKNFTNPEDTKIMKPKSIVPVAKPGQGGEPSK